MSLKDKLVGLRNDLYHTLNFSRDYEFDAELSDHSIGDQNIYRLHFMEYYRKIQYYGKNNKKFNVGIIDWSFKPFMLPNGMERNDAFKVLSYLTDFIEKSTGLEEGSFRSVRTLDNVLDLERLGFKRVEVDYPKDSSEVIDLFTIRGRVLLFKQSKLYQKYFEWYSEGVTFDEVKEIYNKCGIDFYDLIPVIKEKEENNSDEIKLVMEK